MADYIDCSTAEFLRRMGRITDARTNGHVGTTTLQGHNLLRTEEGKHLYIGRVFRLIKSVSSLSESDDLIIAMQETPEKIVWLMEYLIARQLRMSQDLFPGIFRTNPPMKILLASTFEFFVRMGSDDHGNPDDWCSIAERRPPSTPPWEVRHSDVLQ